MYNEYSLLYDEWARCYDPSGKELSIVSRYVDFRGKNVLEIGCGTGRFTTTIAKIAKEVVAIDNDSDSINVAIGRGLPDNIHFKQCDAHDIHSLVYDGLFDIIVFSWSINYINTPEMLFPKLQELLNDNGHVIILFTSTGEYEALMQSVTGEETINSNRYDVIKQLMTIFFSNIKEDYIITPFVFPNIEEAVRLNAFFFENDGIVLTDNILSNLRLKLLSYQKEDGTIVIPDTVKLLVGGKKCSN